MVKSFLCAPGTSTGFGSYDSTFIVRLQIVPPRPQLRFSEARQPEFPQKVKIPKMSIRWPHPSTASKVHFLVPQVLFQ
jgi:hypothetical protein